MLYYLIILPVSLLPFPILYLFSDFLFVVLYFLVGYRKKVVLMNLRNSFPEKSEKEIKKTAFLFYRHLCDVIVESIKSFSISKKQINKRMVLLNPELLNRFYDHNKSVILGGGHYNNWEWIASSLDNQIKHQAIAFYKTLSNKFFDEKVRNSRGRFGLLMVSTKIAKQTFEDFKSQLSATVFAIDQSPGNPQKSHWMTFLNQDTPVLFGMEKYAKEYDYPVLFGTINKIKRGYYTFQFSVVTENPIDTNHGFITEEVTKRLEKEILNAPQYWLWTHKRWKHKRS